MNLQINAYRAVNNNQTPFKGYDARPLKGVLMTASDADSFSIISQMADIGKKNGFKVYFTDSSKQIYTNIEAIWQSIKDKTYRIFTKWAQDDAVLTPQNTVISTTFPQEREFADKVAKVTNGKVSYPQEFIQGGNLFFVKNNGKEELFIGSDEVFRTTNLKKVYGVSKVHVIPQADFHLDLFIRPLNNKTVLVADDNLTLKEIQSAIKNIGKYKKNNNCTESEIMELDTLKNRLEQFLKDFKKESGSCKNPKYNEVAQKLQKSGYTPVPVPGRIYYTVPGGERDDLVHYLNYMNAIVHQKKDNSLVFITNKSNLNEKFNITPEISEKIDFDFEKMLKKALKPYVQESDIHFIEGQHISELLTDEGGGIHCMCNEIPAKL